MSYFETLSYQFLFQNSYSVFDQKTSTFRPYGMRKLLCTPVTKKILIIYFKSNFCTYFFKL